MYDSTSLSMSGCGATVGKVLFSAFSYRLVPCCAPEYALYRSPYSPRPEPSPPIALSANRSHSLDRNGYSLPSMYSDFAPWLSAPPNSGMYCP